MKLRIPSRRVNEGIKKTVRSKWSLATKTQLFALALLPRALTLSLMSAPSDNLFTQLHVDEPAVPTTLTFAPNSPLPLKFDVIAPTMQKGLSRADEERLVKTKQVAQKATTVSTPSAPALPEPSFEEKRVLVREIAQKHGIDWKLLESVWQIESGKRWKTAVNSSAGAVGPMQFMPGTWRGYGGGGDITYAPDALNAGAKLLAANGAASGNIVRALFAYNHAQWYVDKVQKIMNSI